MKTKGFTLIEALLAFSSMIIIAGSILTIQMAFGKNQIISWKNYQNTSSANSIIKTFVKESRAMRISQNGAYPLEKALDNEIVFYSDTDLDGQAEKIRYTLNSTTLEKGITEPQGYPATYNSQNEKIIQLLTYVRNGSTPLFYYFDENWPEDSTTNPLIPTSRKEKTKAVKMFIAVNINSNDPDGNKIFESMVNIRILK